MAAPDELGPYLALWARRIADAQTAMYGARPEQFTVLRYEALCADPTAELARLAAFFGFAAPTEWLGCAAAQVDAPRRTSGQRYAIRRLGQLLGSDGTATSGDVTGPAVLPDAPQP